MPHSELKWEIPNHIPARLIGGPKEVVFLKVTGMFHPVGFDRFKLAK